MMRNQLLQKHVVVVLTLAAGVFALLGGDRLAVAQDAADAAAARRGEIVERATAFRNAFVAGDAESIWGMLSEGSRSRLDQELAELKTEMRRVPQDLRDRNLPGMSISPNGILALAGGQQYLAWLLGALHRADRELVRDLEVKAENVTVDGDRATLRWTLREGGDRAAARQIGEMPQQFVREGQTWRVVISVE